MRKFLTLSVLLPVLALLPSPALCKGMGNDGYMAKVKTQAIVNRLQGAGNDGYLAKVKTLWLDSGNAAGLGTAPFLVFDSADFSFDWQGGSFHQYQAPDDALRLGFDTQGSESVGKYFVWGHFNYGNSTDRGTRYNTLLYNPFDERMIYNVADTTLSDFKRQSYEMEFKLSVPLGKRLYSGLHVSYCDRISAKQQDPRSESVSYELLVAPSLALKLRKFSTLGLDLGYARMQERANPSLSNTNQMQNVFVLKGLGNFVEDFIGSSGLRTMYYSSDSFRAGLQYALEGDIKLFTEARYGLHLTNLREDASQPKEIGLSTMNVLNMNSKMLFASEGVLHKLAINGLYRNTSGTEYASKAVPSVGWQVVSKAVMSKYSTASAGLSYEAFFSEGLVSEDSVREGSERDASVSGGLEREGLVSEDSVREGSVTDALVSEGTVREAGSYRWRFGASLDFWSKNDSYVSPVSGFEYSGIGVGISAGRQFFFKASSLTLGLEAGADKSLSGSYSYQGARAESRPVKEWYPHDLAVLSSDRIRAGFKGDYIQGIRHGMSLGISLQLSYLTPLVPNNSMDDLGSRLGSRLSLSIFF